MYNKYKIVRYQVDIEVSSGNRKKKKIFLTTWRTFRIPRIPLFLRIASLPTAPSAKSVPDFATAQSTPFSFRNASLRSSLRFVVTVVENRTLNVKICQLRWILHRLHLQTLNNRASRSLCCTTGPDFKGSRSRKGILTKLKSSCRLETFYVVEFSYWIRSFLLSSYFIAFVLFAEITRANEY